MGAIDTRRPRRNGAELAAILAAGIGSFALGAFVLLSEAGVFSPPTLYGPAGVSGRIVLAVFAWLIAWGALHGLWRNRQVEARGVYVTTLVLVALGVAGCVPLLLGALG